MDIYSTGVLTRVVSNLIVPQSFFLDRYFGEEVRSDTDTISFDIDTRKRRLAPFVSPLVQGKVVDGPGFQTSTFKPAYVKDKRRLDPMKPVKRAIGEQIGGSMSAAQREEANLAINLEDQIQMLIRRQEHMAIDALLDGITVVSGEGYAPVSVNFGRHTDLSVALLTTARWGEAGVSPADDVEKWAELVGKHSGASPTEIIFDGKAWALFKADPKVEKALDLWRGGGSTIEMGAQPAIGATHKGKYGNLDLFVYVDWYVDDNDVLQPMLPDYSVIMGSPHVDGVRHYGAIMDPALGYASLPYAPKSWIDNDPPVRWLMLQSAPLPVPYRVNASFRATVR